MPSSDMDERRRSARKRHARPSAHSAALESLRAAREGRESRTDQVIDDDDDGVYDEVTEEEYQELVRKRQQADDFVVDDDGLGYADDGEEFIDRVEEDEAKARGGKFGAASRKGVNGKMNADTLRRKARKLNQLEDEAPQAAGIKKFLQTGGASTVGPASLARAKLGGLKGSGASLNLDDMLSDLTSNPLADLAPGSGGGSASAKRKKQRSMLSPESVRSSRGYSLGSNLGSASGARGRNHAGGSSGARRSSNSSAAWTVRDYEEDEPGTGGDEVSMEAAMPMDDDGERDRAVEPHASAPSPPRRAPKFDEGDDEDAMVVQDGAGDGAASEGRGHSSAGNGAASRTKELLPGSGQGTASEIAASRYASAGVEPAGHAPPESAVKESEAAGGAKPRSRFERMKEANTISVTAAAEAVLRPKQERAADELDTADAGGDAREGARKADNPGGGYMPSLDFQGPQYSLSETPSTPAGALPSTSSWLRKDKAGEYLQMFWFDATEENGTIYLMGKVVVSAQGGGEGATAFLSACVAVHGIERELFVLPRLTTDRGETGGDDTGEKAKGSSGGDGVERMDMSSVYAEMHKALVPKVIPRNARGETFGGKAVKRKYAFGDVAVPREETQYLKIKYPARYPSLSEDVCEAGGETFQTIFGARTPLIESFLIKRKLMGPCWLTVRNPKVNDGPVSWCKVEVAVQSPKAITRLTPEDMDTSGNGNVGDGNAGISKPAPSGGAGKLPPPPPVVTMSLSMKTVVSPRTHTHEVVALSALIHREVRLDGPSSDEGSKMSAWIAIRPLGLSAGDEFPKVFPHDIKTEAKAAEASARRAGKGAAPIQTMPNERALLSLFFQKLQQEDPDVLVAHNLMGFDFDILLSRAVALKLATWSKIGRLRRNKPPRAYSSGHGMKGSGSSFNANIASGRLLCDTYLSAKEFLRETTYSLTHLAGTQLKAFRSGVDPGDVPRFFGSSADIVRLALHTVNDACLVQRLMFKLQIIPLSCQLTSLSGNLWCRTMRGGRAERIEYLLLHEFHQRKFITPEKVAYGANKDGAGGGTKKAKGKQGSSGGVGAKEVGDDDGELTEFE